MQRNRVLGLTLAINLKSRSPARFLNSHLKLGLINFAIARSGDRPFN
ncbi:hypothetical protein [Tychonema sp. LEGE 07203]|nr:hypothetical protein [Tychonema sp. LEGE 07203]MBE9093326.1 hypothetical protein [Tychonema sp. LEGE 07203]